MKRIGYILFAALLAGCNLLEEPGMMPSYAPQGERVQINFSVAVPDGGAETKAMGLNPTIDPDGFYVAVFGGSGYFNEWVKATIVSASANYDGTSATKYTLSVSLSVSDSRLRVHFIANCPSAIRDNPPISGSQDTEDNVMSKIRSQLSESYNDGYWQKIILPNGVKAIKEEVNGVETWVATDKTKQQFPDPIVMVRNFARVYLRNLTPTYYINGVADHQLVTIKAFGLAYAPSEGTIAPMLAAPYTSNASGAPITVSDDDNDTPIYYENFFINYQNYPIESEDNDVILLTGAPFNYNGFSPSDQAYEYYPNNADKGVPVDANLQAWNSENPEANMLYVYERTAPTAERRATRLIIKAERVDEAGNSDGDRYYALDIVNSDGISIPLLRNQTYTVHLLNIEAGSGEEDISKASKASSATVSGDPTFQNLINISDGKSSIGTSFTEKFYVQPQEDFVMFRYIPTNVNETVNEVEYIANKDYPDLVTIDVGTVNTTTAVFTPVSPADAEAQGILTFAVENGEYKVWVDKDNNNKVISYVRSHNDWVPATAAQIEDINIEKWAMIKYQLNESYIDSDNYFTNERTMAICVLGSFNGRDMTRNVIIKTSPRQTMQVNCVQKYVMKQSGQAEEVRILIPTGMSRSVFPLEFDIEPNGYSLTPNGDDLPVAYGTSIIPNNNGPSFYFVKTLTKTAYDALPTVRVDNKTWKEFVCHFKTTVADNACTVYVYNRYFREDNSSDEFFNFEQRLFTNSSNNTTTLALSPSTVYRHGNTTLAFVLDYAHRNNTHVWWDPNNTLGQSANAAEAAEKGLSNDNRVYPPIFTVELIGFTPQYEEDGETPVTTALRHVSGNKYSYNVGSGTPTSDMATITLALTGSGSVSSTATVKLSTANLTENPSLYAMNTVSTTIQAAQFSNVRFGSSDTYTLPLGLNQNVTFRFSYTSGMVVPITVRLDGLALNGTGENNLLMTANGDGTYTFTPTNTNTTTYYLALKSTTRFSPASVTLSHDDYEDVTKTANRSASFQIPAQALYFRNSAGTGNPSDFQQNNTYVYMNNTSTYSTSSYLARSRSGNNNYYNSSAITVTLSNFSIANDDATVYFAYKRGNNYSTYYATSTLSELLDATTSNRVTLRFSTTRPN